MQSRIERLGRIVSYMVLGKRSVSAKEPPRVSREVALHVETDYTFTVYYEEIRFLVRYERWWVPDRQFSVFRMSAQCGPGAPARLQEAVKEPLYLPEKEFHSSWTHSSVDSARNAYIDVILARIKRTH